MRVSLSGSENEFLFNCIFKDYPILIFWFTKTPAITGFAFRQDILKSAVYILPSKVNAVTLTLAGIFRFEIVG